MVDVICFKVALSRLPSKHFNRKVERASALSSNRLNHLSLRGFDDRSKRAGTSPVSTRRLWKGRPIFSRATENGPAFRVSFVCADKHTAKCRPSYRSGCLDACCARLGPALTVVNGQMHVVGGALPNHNMSASYLSHPREERSAGGGAPGRSMRKLQIGVTPRKSAKAKLRPESDEPARSLPPGRPWAWPSLSPSPPSGRENTTDGSAFWGWGRGWCVSFH